MGARQPSALAASAAHNLVATPLGELSQLLGVTVESLDSSGVEVNTGVALPMVSYGPAPPPPPTLADSAGLGQSLGRLETLGVQACEVTKA